MKREDVIPALLSIFENCPPQLTDEQAVAVAQAVIEIQRSRFSEALDKIKGRESHLGIVAMRKSQ